MCRYIDDFIVFSNKKFIYYVKDIYPSELNVAKLTDCITKTFIVGDNNRLCTKLYNKLDDFNFHIVNFSFLSSNIPFGPPYSVYISQPIRYARCCIYYDDFGYHHKLLVDRLLSQGYQVNQLRKSFQKFYGRYQDLVAEYQKPVRGTLNDSFPF